MIDVRRFVRRHVLRRTEAYQAYLRLPTRLPSGESIVGDARDLADDVETICEGKLDVYGTADGMVLDTDVISASHFDVERFERVLERLEERYSGPYSVAVLRKRRVDDARRRITTYVVVPVRPLFPRDRPRITG